MAQQWTLIIKNNSGADRLVTDLGWLVEDEAVENAHEQFTYPDIAGSDSLRTLVAAGTLVVNDGANDLSSADGVKYLVLGHKKYIEGLAASLQSGIDAAQGVADAALPKAGGTMSGDIAMGDNEITTTVDPSSGNSLTRRSYVDARILGIAPKAGVEARTTEPLPFCTYGNGDGGVGASLTSSDQALPALDGWAPEVGKSILVANQADAKQNGVYVIDVISDPMDGFFKLTRRVDLDGSPDNELMPGTRVTIRQGVVWAGYAATLLGVANTPRVVGTDTITFDFVPGTTSTAQVQNEIDAVEEAVGLTGDGTLAALSGRYIGSSPDIVSAIVSLDAGVDNAQDTADQGIADASTAQATAESALAAAQAAQATADNVGTVAGMAWDLANALQAELNATQTGAGFGEDGQYLTPSTSNYLGDAGSLADADLKLDAAVKAVADSVAELGGGTLSDLKVVSGIMYAKDSVRNRWLGQRETFMMGRSGNTKNMFLELCGVPSNASGIRMTGDRVITSLGLQLNASGTCTLNVRKNGSATNIATLTLTAAAGGSAENLNIPVSAGDYLQFFLAATNAVSNPVASIGAAVDGGSL